MQTYIVSEKVDGLKVWSGKNVWAGAAPSEYAAMAKAMDYVPDTSVTDSERHEVFPCEPEVAAFCLGRQMRTRGEPYYLYNIQDQFGSPSLEVFVESGYEKAGDTKSDVRFFTKNCGVRKPHLDDAGEVAHKITLSPEYTGPRDLVAYSTKDKTHIFTHGRIDKVYKTGVWELALIRYLCDH